MATITITTDPTKDARIADAFDAEFPGRIVNGVATMTKAQWIKQQLINDIKQVVRNYEANLAASAARSTAEADVNAFTIT